MVDWSSAWTSEALDHGLCDWLNWNLFRVRLACRLRLFLVTEVNFADLTGNYPRPKRVRLESTTTVKRCSGKRKILFLKPSHPPECDSICWSPLNPIHGSVWFVQILSTSDAPRLTHLIPYTAVCGSFRSFLPATHQDSPLNPTHCRVWDLGLFVQGQTLLTSVTWSSPPDHPCCCASRTTP